jgi:hypothetical protein
MPHHQSKKGGWDAHNALRLVEDPTTGGTHLETVVGVLVVSGRVLDVESAKTPE